MPSPNLAPFVPYSQPEKFQTYAELRAENKTLDRALSMALRTSSLHEQSAIDWRKQYRAASDREDALTKRLVAVGKEGGERCPKCRGTLLAIGSVFDGLDDIELAQELDAFGRRNFEECEEESCFGGWLVEVGS